MPEPASATLTTATPQRLAAATAEAIAAAEADLAVLLSPAGTLNSYDEATNRLEDIQRVAELIANVHPDPQLRAAAELSSQQVESVLSRIALDPLVYQALGELERADPAAATYPGDDPVTRYYLSRVRRDFQRNGVDRDPATRERIKTLRDELLELGQQFNRAINTDRRVVTVAQSSLVGLPPEYVQAHQPGPDGLVEISTDTPDLVPFLAYSPDGAARGQLWREFLRRAHPANEAVLRQMLQCRHELAALLGYPNWADYITGNKMIGSAKAVAEFIAEITQAAAVRAQADYRSLLARKQRDEPAAQRVFQWDRAYLENLLRTEQFGFDSLQARPYFEFDQVLAAVLELAGRLFQIEFTRAQVPVWHPDVQAYQAYRDGQLFGEFFLDLHPRPDKYGHAAVFSLRRGRAGTVVPQCALVCNFPRPGEQPALLQYTDVVTFLHEFGHLVHNLFAGHQRWHGVGGLTAERDFVEAPSQLLEEWVRDPQVLTGFARHYQTGEPIPTDLVERMVQAERFGRGLAVRTQMYYAALSLQLHLTDPVDLDPVALEAELVERYTPFRYVPDTYLHLSFGHLDGYSATYYTYMWSLVIAKDLFTRFQAEGLPALATAVGYRDAILARGASAPAGELVSSFLGRAYTAEAYRRWLDG